MPDLPFASCQIVADPLKEAIDLAPAEGYFIEFGVCSGKTLRRLAEARPGKTIGLDTFTGLPEKWREQYPAGSFSQDGKIPDVPGADLIKGLFSETTKNLDVQSALVHIDCDLYQGAKDALIWTKSHYVSGCIVLFDEIFAYDGFEEHELKAYQEVVDWPHEWILRSDDSGQKAAFVCL